MRRVSAWFKTVVVSATTASNTSVSQADSNIYFSLTPTHRKLEGVKRTKVFFTNIITV